VTQWALVVLIAAILFLLLEARLSLGTRMAVLERDIAWMAASLEKWGLVAPKKESRPAEP
jgi:hypothetical protein